MKSTIRVLKEQIEHFYLIRRLSLYELKSQHLNNYLGMAWEVLNPLIQIMIYWFVFSSLRPRPGIEIATGEMVPFIYWLLGAFILWTFFYQATIQGSKSIYSRLQLLSKMNFPMSVIPSITIFSQIYIHIVLMGVTIIVFTIGGYHINIYYIQLFYYLFATISLVFAISLITSTLSTIIRDVHMFLNATLRMFLYLSPILWEITTIVKNKTALFIIKLNPLNYLIGGYRSALFGTNWHFIENWKYTLYFWVLVLLLLMIGSVLHIKFRRHFIDYL